MEKIEKDSKIKKFTVWITLLFMPMSTYATPISGITYGDIMLIFATLIIMCYIGYSKIKLNRVITGELICYIFFILINSLVIWIVKFGALQEGILSVLRYILYILWVAISAKYFFDFKYACKIYKILAIIFAVYAILQFIAFYVFNKVLPINILGLPAVNYVNQFYTAESIHYYQNGTLLFRPFSVFIEPAYFAMYEIPILCIVLNECISKEKRKYLFGLIISISLILASTTTGIILMVFCWYKPILIKMKKNIKTFFIFIVLLVIIGVYFINSPFMDKVLGRIINEDGTLGASVTGRIGKMHVLFDGTYEFSKILFGQGMWAETEFFLPSYGRIIIAFGIIGMLFILSMLAYSYKKANKLGKKMIILILITFIGTNTLFNISSVLMFTMIYSNMKGVKEENVNLSEK